ncbi:ISAs1 family transposase, partial [Glaesserella parasuis]|nr:ISAs1 family transposase [Glaesserella parasuis]
SGANSWTEIKLFGELHLDWLRKYRPFECGIPVDDTIARVIKRIEPQAFNEVFLNFINEIRTQQGREVIAIDGKTLRHSFNPETQSALHSVTVWSQSRGLILSQKKSSGKQNEQQAVMEIIDSFCLKNAVITVDAMNTQKKIAEKIIEKKGDYVMPLKKNHRQFQSEVEAYFHKISRDCPEMLET